MPPSATSTSPPIAVAPSDSLLRRSSRESVPPPALPKGTVHADGACKPGPKKLQASKVAPISSQTPARQPVSVRPPPEPPPDTSSRRPNLSNSIYEFGSPHMSDLARATIKGRMQRDGTYNDPLGRLEPGGSCDKHPPTPPVPPAPPPPGGGVCSYGDWTAPCYTYCCVYPQRGRVSGDRDRVVTWSK